LNNACLLFFIAFARKGPQKHGSAHRGGEGDGECGMRKKGGMKTNMFC